MTSRDKIQDIQLKWKSDTKIPGIQISRFETLKAGRNCAFDGGSVCSIGSKQYVVIHSDAVTDLARFPYTTDYSPSGSHSSRSLASRRASSGISSCWWGYAASPRDSEWDADVSLGSRDFVQGASTRDWSGGPARDGSGGPARDGSGGPTRDGSGGPTRDCSTEQAAAAGRRAINAGQMTSYLLSTRSTSKLSVFSNCVGARRHSCPNAAPSERTKYVHECTCEGDRNRISTTHTYRNVPEKTLPSPFPYCLLLGSK